MYCICIIVIMIGIVWCMDHEEDTGTDTVDQMVADTSEVVMDHLQQKPTFSGWSHSETDIQTMITSSISGLRNHK